MKINVKSPTPALYGYWAILNTEGITALECDSVDSGTDILDGLGVGAHCVALAISARREVIMAA